MGSCLAALTLAGCGNEDSTVEGPVTVYVSLPQTGERAADGNDAADGARLALEQAGGRAGELEVRAEYLDDARGGIWDPVAVGQNARRAVQDSSTAAYIGELDSQPTRASLPITNDGGIAQVSPGAGALDLTMPAQGYPDSPERYRPSGEATFARVIPNDEALSRAGARQAVAIGVDTVAAEFDPSDPWEALVAEEFEQEALAEGLQPTERSPKPDPRQAVLVPGPDDLPLLLLLIGRGGVSVSPTLSPASLPPAGQDFVAAFRERYGRDPHPLGYAAYGYEAMSAVLAAIEGRDPDEGTFRQAVVDSLLRLERPDSVLGSYSFTANGDSTLCEMQVYRLGAGTREGTVCAPG